MKQFFWSLLVILTISFISCDKKQDIQEQLAVPENLTITVVGRAMTVTWDTVENASGYILETASTNCGSGNRIVNTVKGTVALPNGNNAAGTIVPPAAFTLTLMAAPGSTTEAMATSITAKVMAVGNGISYTDSEFSCEITLYKADYLGD